MNLTSPGKPISYSVTYAKRVGDVVVANLETGTFFVCTMRAARAVLPPNFTLNPGGIVFVHEAQFAALNDENNNGPTPPGV